MITATQILILIAIFFVLTFAILLIKYFTRRKQNQKETTSAKTESQNQPPYIEYWTSEKIHIDGDKGDTP